MSLCREQPTVFKILVGEIPTAKLQGERQHWEKPCTYCQNCFPKWLNLANQNPANY